MQSCRSLMLPALALVTLSLALTQGEVIPTRQCHIAGHKTPTCTVHEVRVDPCPPAGRNVACKLGLGTHAILEFDYTPTFSAEKVGTLANKVGSLFDVPFATMDTDGCKTTTCPVEANKKQTYKYELQIGTNTTQFPTMIHEVKWKLWNEDNHKEQCCFQFQLQLSK